MSQYVVIIKIQAICNTTPANAAYRAFLPQANQVTQGIRETGS